MLGLSLREFCREHGFDPANVSRIERGISPPPKSAEIIESFAIALEFKNNSADWRKLHQLAAAETGQLPEQIADDPAKLKKVFGAFDRTAFQWTRAIHLESGADLRMFQARLPELIRKLMHSTTPSLARISAPAGEGIQRPGFDIMTENETATPFVPSGATGWELGTTKDVKSKANDDFQKRTANKNLTATQRRQMTYIQVTPRKWTDKKKWSDEKNRLNKWKEVRVYDSADLEEWLELAPAVDAWISRIFGIRPKDVTSLADYWERLRHISDPPLQPNVFLVSRAGETDAIKNWLEGTPSILKFEHSSPQEPIDMFAAWIASADERTKALVHSKAIIVESVSAWNEMSISAYPLILIADPGLSLPVESIRDAESNGLHVLISSTRLITKDKAMRLSRPLNHELEEALLNCGFNPEQSRKFTQEAGGSLSILKRRVAKAPTNQIPVWAQSDTATRLVPLILAGGWHERNEYDKNIIEELTGRRFSEVIAFANEMLSINDPPLSNILSVWSVVSREDSWDLLARNIDSELLGRFENVVEKVLKDDDPRFDLPAEDRWLAQMKNKSPRYSGILRNGIVNTVALLGARSSALSNALNPIAEATANNVIRKVLSKTAPWQRWATLSRQLPDLAEASPSAFLQAAEKSLELGKSSQLIQLFEQTGEAPMGGCLHAGLLWALEALAWKPEYLSKVARILAMLDRLAPSTRWSNSPISSLGTIFLPWLPYTGATVDQRIGAIEKLVRDEPDVGWKLLISLMPQHHAVASPTHFPSWRDWAATWSREFSQSDFDKFISSCADLIVEQVGDQIERWESILENFGRIPDQWQLKLIAGFMILDVEAIDKNVRSRLTGLLRKSIRKNRDHADAPWALSAAIVDQLETVQAKLEPDDLVQKHAWLFRDWVELEGLYEMGVDEHDKKLELLRLNALTEIVASGGLQLVLDLAMLAEAPFQVGWTLARMNEANFDLNFIPEHICANDEKLTSMTLGICRYRFKEQEWNWIDGLDLTSWGDDQVGLIHARVGGLSKIAWKRVSKFGASAERMYWENVSSWNRDAPLDDVVFATKKFLKVSRPISSINVLEGAIRRDLKPDADLVATVLETAMDNEAKKEEAVENIGDDVVYTVQQLIGYLQERLDEDDAIRQRLATIEWRYLGLLKYSEVTAKTLFATLSEDPGFFVQLLQLMFRSDHETEPTEPSEADGARMENAYHLLHEWKAVPGIRADGSIDGEKLAKWVDKARIACRESGHLFVCESQIGQHLAFAPAETEDESDRHWPCIAVRDVLEEVDSEAMFDGFQIGIFNKRGVQTRSPYAGGESERKLQTKYSQLASALAIEWPSTSACLQRLADDYGRRAKVVDGEAELRKRRS